MSETTENTETTETTETTEGTEVVSPDTLYANKYKSVSELEKGYESLSSKLGSQTGAPDEYTVKEGIEIDDNNPLFNNFNELGKKLGINNDGYNEIVEMYNNTLTEQQALQEKQIEKEMIELGDNAEERIKNVEDWAGANLSEEEGTTLRELAISANAVRLIEKFIQNGKPQNVSTDSQTSNKSSYDKDKLNKMRFEKDENGNRRMSVDSSYRAKVLRLEEQYG